MDLIYLDYAYKYKTLLKANKKDTMGELRTQKRADEILRWVFGSYYSRLLLHNEKISILVIKRRQWFSTLSKKMAEKETLRNWRKNNG